MRPEPGFLPIPLCSPGNNLSALTSVTIYLSVFRPAIPAVLLLVLRLQRKISPDPPSTAREGPGMITKTYAALLSRRLFHRLAPAGHIAEVESPALLEGAGAE